jgi:hypothetical protein
LALAIAAFRKVGRKVDGLTNAREDVVHANAKHKAARTLIVSAAEPLIKFGPAPPGSFAGKFFSFVGTSLSEGQEVEKGCIPASFQIARVDLGWSQADLSMRSLAGTSPRPWASTWFSPLRPRRGRWARA